ncbi:hypothetical protein MGN01_09940 [Methylobacterium gnaphalii]|uniref:Uncharacterized protein n=1 Tax=Methylobacterium gnaphalii TaxID=1010610 RepID=A0A512JGQ4_9HYPH|nr:hypothetical protein MGN01_09940 [Methylobacterium gnaphalii]GLS50472.1 hypothetical protein GCM10007885_33240 [Methylobacterium gnaphalii]
MRAARGAGRAHMVTTGMSSEQRATDAGAARIITDPSSSLMVNRRFSDVKSPRHHTREKRLATVRPYGSRACVFGASKVSAFVLQLLTNDPKISMHILKAFDAFLSIR